MAQSREIISVVLFNGQIVFSRRLFEPETADMAGKPLDKPRFSCNVRFPKTKAVWWEEPALASVRDACGTIVAREFGGNGNIEYPVKDGDLPNQKGKVPDWSKGHWIIKADTTYQPKVEQLVNGQPSEIQSLSIGGRQLWQDGDFVGVTLAVAKRAMGAPGIKSYLNGVCFTDKGAVLSTGAPATDWAAAIAKAEQQGIQVQMGGGGGGDVGAATPAFLPSGTAPAFTPPAPSGFSGPGVAAPAPAAFGGFGGGAPAPFDPNKPPF